MPKQYDPLSMQSIPEFRYQHDEAFKGLVDTMHYFIQRAQFTPTELREAALLACIHYESCNLRSQYLDPDQFNLSQVESYKKNG